MTRETYEHRIPEANEFVELFSAVGWDPYEPAAIAASLEGSLFGVVATLDGRAIAMGRVVGDGGTFFYIQDFVVHPDHQGRGVGRRIVELLLSAIEAASPGKPFVGVFSTPEAVSLYRDLGLDNTFGGLTGMATVIEQDDA